MRGDAMRWIGWLVALVFGAGVLALLGLVVALVRSAEGVPPMPIYMGILGCVALILLAGACLALISIAVSVRRGVDLLQRGAAPAAEAVAKPQGPFSPAALAEVPAAPRAARAGKVLVAER
ncbi:hypothetical protein [Paracoccus beibuensis]|uniref:hypothetical protein n=1 Tax=Paracoccus beibuensis TaxID=547602 RepID=UPI00223EB9D1|nr:hypothetical protein [Paracoccus beibuensis]